ncbi:MAG: hypothetical protein ACREDL_20015 [Bradyrhizobium sp.]
MAAFTSHAAASLVQAPSENLFSIRDEMSRESSLRLSVTKHGRVTANGGEKLHGSSDADGILQRECCPIFRQRSV